MRSLALRVILAGLLIGSVAAKARLAYADPPDFRAAVLDLVSRSGWLASEETDRSDEPLGNAIRVDRGGCESAGLIFVVDLSLQASPMLNHLIAPEYTRHFLYLGRSWPTLDRMGMRLEWLKQKSLSAFGLGQYVVNESALVIAQLPHCRIAEEIDWSTLWRRRAEQAVLPSGKR